LAELTGATRSSAAAADPVARRTTARELLLQLPRVRILLAVLLAACYRGSSPPEGEAPPSAGPELRIEGRWDYRVRTNECNEGTGTGTLELVARGGDTYHETGRVRWPDGTAIEWAGDLRYSRTARTFEATQLNSLDDAVESRWYVDRERGWLVMRWRQSNGCSGLGIATRPGAPEASFAALPLCAGCEASARGCDRIAEGRGRAGRTSACAPLCCR
jgi:hypothetical protein